MCWIGFHDRWENQVAPDLLLRDRQDRELGSDGGPFGDGDPLPRADQGLHFLDSRKWGTSMAEGADVNVIAAGDYRGCDENKRQEVRWLQRRARSFAIARIATRSGVERLDLCTWIDEHSKFTLSEFSNELKRANENRSSLVAD